MFCGPELCCMDNSSDSFRHLGNTCFGANLICRSSRFLVLFGGGLALAFSNILKPCNNQNAHLQLEEKMKIPKAFVLLPFLPLWVKIISIQI